MPELRLRIMSGVVLAIVVLLITWAGGFGFKLFAGLISLLVFYEWSTITHLRVQDRVGNTAGWSSQIFIAGSLVFGPADASLAFLGAFLFVLTGRAILRKTSLWLPAGVLYAGLSGVSINAIRGDQTSGLVATLFVFAVVWGTDILAFFVGRAIGGPKLAPKISPGKTWSGAMGGTISGVIAGAAFLTLAGYSLNGWLIGLAFFLSISGQIGDLFESFVKRRFGVKDSSHLIPGHGGVMDRVDALVFAAFAAFLIGSVAIYIDQGGMGDLGSVLLGLGR